MILNDIISRPGTLEIESSVEPTSGEKDKANTEQKVRNERENTDMIEPKKPSSSSVAKPAAKSLSDVDRLKNIAMNSREVRLIGADGKEVEMKDDVPTKIVVAFENLQKEASQVWDQVNTKLDKGWNDFKVMVERAVTKQQQQQQQPENKVSSRSLRELPKQEKSTLVFVDDVDGYSMADDDTMKAAQTQLESAGSKIKGFFSDIGLNEDNTKKAGDALSKAGTAVSETMTKDLPDAFKKASSAVSDTVTKDIPDAFKNFFG